MTRTTRTNHRLMMLVVIVLAAAGCAVRRARPLALERPLPNDAWFAKQRMSRGEPIPVGALTRAKEARVRAPAPGTWSFVGPTNIGGRLTALAVDPNDSNHVWAGAAAGGVFVSSDAGTTWIPVFDDQPLLPVGAVAAHPTNSNIVYVGTGEANGAGYSYDGDGVYRTIDGGVSFQHLGLAETRRIGRIAIDPVDPQRVFVAAAGGVYAPDGFRGVYRSVDSGISWTRVLFISPTTGAIDVAIDPSNPSRIYAAMWEHYSTPIDWVAGGLNSGIWRSQDGGDTWTRLINGLPASSAAVGRIGLAIAASSPQTVYALYINDPGSLIGVYKTTNAGASWARVDTPGGPQTSIFGGYGYYFGQIRVDPGNANIVYLLDVYWARSTDGGVNYTNHTSGLHVDHHDVLIFPSKLYMANDGGFYRSVDAGTSWFHSPSLPLSQLYDLGIDPVDPRKRFGGLQDNGSARTTNAGTANWTSVNGGDGFQCEVDPINPLRVYYESQYGGIRRSSDGGNTSASGTSGITSTDRKNWNTPIVHDPRTTARLYTATHRVYRSIDAAQTWTAISGDLTDGPPLQSFPSRDTKPNAHLASAVEGTITTLAVSPVDANVLWAGTDDGHVWASQTSGSVWSKVDVSGRSEWVTRVEADPFSASSAYVTFSGYRYGSPLPRIFRTTNFGMSWTDLSAGLPDVPLNCVNADPNPTMRGRLFVCSDLGVYVTDNYGRSWSALSSGMPAVVVHDLDLIDSSRQLFAGTHGRSIYAYDLNQLGPADADADGRDNLADCKPEDSGVFAAPGEVTGLVFDADRSTLSFDSAAPAAGSATEHQLLRGLVNELPVGAASDICLAVGTLASSAADADVPPPEQAFWYLVRARNACGTGTYGSTSGGSPRLGVACP